MKLQKLWRTIWVSMQSIIVNIFLDAVVITPELQRSNLQETAPLDLSGMEEHIDIISGRLYSA